MSQTSNESSFTPQKNTADSASKFEWVSATKVPIRAEENKPKNISSSSDRKLIKKTIGKKLLFLKYFSPVN